MLDMLVGVLLLSILINGVWKAYRKIIFCSDVVLPWKWLHFIVCSLKYIHYYFTPDEFFTPAITGGFLLEFEWQKVFLDLQDSSQYSRKSQQFCCLDNFNSSSDFQYLLSFFQPFGNLPKFINYIWHHSHPIFYSTASSLGRSKYVSVFSLLLF